VVIHDQVELPRVYMAWLTSPIFKPGDAEADLAAEILGGGKSSRLYKKLVYEKQIALDVSASQQSLILGSVFEIVVTARPGHTAEEMEKAVDAELAAFRKDGPTAVELERARNGTETGMIEGLERLGGFGGRGRSIERVQPLSWKSRLFPQDVRRYQSATTDSIRAFAEAQLKPAARVVVYGIPGKPDLGPDVPTPQNQQKGQSTGGESVNADAAWRDNPPKPGPARPLNLPVPDVFKLSNGLTVYYHYRPDFPWRRRILFSIRAAARIPSKSPASRVSRRICCSRERHAERHADCRRSGAPRHGPFFRREHGFVQRRRELAYQEFPRGARSDFGHCAASDVSAR
jgi:zinc protease